MKVKEATREGIVRFVIDGLRPGDFLQAVLRNDLQQAFARADLENLRDLKEIAGFVFMRVPLPCYGSKAKVDRWIKQGGYRGSEVFGAAVNKLENRLRSGSDEDFD